MNISLYTNSSDKRMLHKSVSLITTISAELVNPSNLVKPQFIVTNANATSANYVYCSKFSRYYYIDDITFTAGGRKILHCSVDVLMSFQSQISALNVHVVRNSVKPTYIKDIYLPMLQDKDVETIPFLSGDFNLTTANENSYNYVLNVAGG